MNRKTDNLPVYTTVMMAVIVGLQVVEEVRPDRMLLLTLKQSSLWQDLLFEIFQCVFRIQRLGTDVEFCWGPAHVGLG